MRRGALTAILAGSVCLASCAPAAATGDGLARGRQVYGEAGCATCHDAGLPNLWRPVGPPLDHIGTVAAGRRPGVSAEGYIRESIVDPGAYLVPGYPDSMPRGFAEHISEADLAALVAYLASLR